MIETIGDLVRGRRRPSGLTQLVQPTADRADERVAPVPFDSGRVPNASSNTAAACLQFHATGQLHRADSETGLFFPDIDEDAVGAHPRPLDRGDQTLAALIGSQIAHSTAALVRPTLVDRAVKTAPDVVFVKRKPLDRGKPTVGE